FLAGATHHVQQMGAGQNAVALRNVSVESVAATLFAADHRIYFQHLGGDIFETDTRLIHRHVINFGQLVQHLRGRNRLHNRTALAAYLQEVITQQAKDAKLVDELTVLVAKPNTVSISIVDDGDVSV